MPSANKKRILVTGGASGIGKAIAQRAIERGHSIIISDVNLAGADALAKSLGPNASPLSLDVTSMEGWEAALDQIWREFGGLDVLINNAGIVYPGNALSVPLAGHQHTMDVNFMGAMRGMLAAYPRLAAQGHGQLVTVCSMTAFIPSTGLASYAASKHALRAFHHAMALEQRNGPIDFSIVYPTATETPMLQQEAENDDTALAFAAPPVSPEYVGKVVIRAMELRRVEVFMPENRGAWIRKVGSSPKLMRALIEPGTQAGLAALSTRRGAAKPGT